MSSTFLLAFLCTRIPLIPQQIRYKRNMFRKQEILQSPVVKQQIVDTNTKILRQQLGNAALQVNTNEQIRRLLHLNHIPSMKRNIGEIIISSIYTLAASYTVIRALPLPTLGSEGTTSVALIIGLATWTNVEIQDIGRRALDVSGAAESLRSRLRSYVWRGFSLLAIPIASYIPSTIAVYWLCSACFSAIFNGLLLVPWFASLVGVNRMWTLKGLDGSLTPYVRRIEYTPLIRTRMKQQVAAVA